MLAEGLVAYATSDDETSHTGEVQSRHDLAGENLQAGR